MYQKILVPLDGSELAECVLPHVETVAKGCEAAKIVLVRVVEPVRRTRAGSDYYVGNELWDKLEADSRAAAQDYIKKMAGSLKFGAGVAGIVLLPEDYDVAGTIARYATKENADLIIISTHGRSGVSRWVWGSVADRILRSACVPVMMVRAPGCIQGIQS